MMMNEEQLKKDRELLRKWDAHIARGGFVQFDKMPPTEHEGFIRVSFVPALLEAQARVVEAEVRKDFMKLIKQEMKDNLMRCQCYVNRCDCNDSTERLLKLLSPNPEQDGL